MVRGALRNPHAVIIGVLAVLVLGGVASQQSRSMIGVSVVRDYFRSDIDPNTAMSQVSSLAISDLYYLPPGTIPPMVMPFDPTASLPLALLSVSSPSLDETRLYDVAYFDLRNRL